MSTDALFFFQLLFPIADPAKSGIDGDNRLPYFSHAALCTNGYAMFAGGGSGTGHEFRAVNEVELVHWTVVPICHGAYDGQPGNDGTMTIPGMTHTLMAQSVPLCQEIFQTEQQLCRAKAR